MAERRKKALVNGVSKKGKFPPILFGLEGIMNLFNVSKSTAMRYKNGFLKPAVTQHGTRIIIDTKKALKCFGMLEAERFVD